jgi:hypothetical protein
MQGCEAAFSWAAFTLAPWAINTRAMFDIGPHQA